LEQLKGKNLGISGFRSNTHYAALILLKHLAQACDLQKINEAHFSCDGRCGQIEKRGIDFSGVRI
jgi:hypothetical protein